ncbi:hypothetical protein DL770_007068 [Monosporascus sp. CRB-9-2]|nr:hypothetical protein DL770_007068 [Monosporascus sp. CRB-9-2]
MPTEDRQKTLRAHIDNGRNGLRPVMTSINGDNSWLISFPRPVAEHVSAGRSYYHVVLEPWLAEPGYSVFVAPWFSRTHRNCVAAATDGASVDAVVREIEQAAGSTGHAAAGVDAIFICYAGADHGDRQTLLTFAPSVPVFADPAAAKTISGWGHFDRVVDIATFDGTSSWQASHPGAPLPGWLSVMSLKTHFHCFGFALVWSHDDEKHEVILSFPHGFRPEKDTSVVGSLLGASPPLRILAMMHPLKESFVWGTLMSPGVRNGLQLWRMAGPKYWVNTGDMEFIYAGVFMWGVYDKRHTLDWALKLEQNETRADAHLARPGLVNIENGACYVLE